MNLLTSPCTITILYSLPNCSNRDWRSEYKRHSRVYAVFLCLKHSFPLLWWAERSGRKAGRSLYRYANFVQSATHDWRHRLGGLFIKLVQAMTNHTQNPAYSRRITPRQSLFNLVKRTEHGLQVIRADLTFTQISGLLVELPSLIVKFSRMEVTHGL